MTDAPESASPAPGALISAAVQQAIADTLSETTTTIITGQDVVHGLIDALAFVLHKSPHTQMVRDRRLYLDEVRDALAAQVNAYQAAASKVVAMPVKPRLLVGLGGDAA